MIPHTTPTPPKLTADDYQRGDIVTVAGRGHYAGRTGPIVSVQTSTDGRITLQVDALQTRVPDAVQGIGSQAGAHGGTLPFDPEDVRKANRDEIDRWQRDEWPSARRYAVQFAARKGVEGR